MVKTEFVYEVLDSGVRFFLERKKFPTRTERIPLDTWNENAAGPALNAVSLLLSLTDEDDVVADAQSVTVPHSRIANLDAKTAEALNLPEISPFVLSIQGQGAIAQQDFSLNTTWLTTAGQAALGLRRLGSIMLHGERQYRLPGPIFTLVETIERFNAETQQDSIGRLKAWAAIQDFVHVDGDSKIRPDAFLLSTHVAHAAAFSLSLKTSAQEFDFDPVLFGPKTLSSADGFDNDTDEDEAGNLTKEAEHLLPPAQQNFFADERFPGKSAVRDQYALKNGWYVVLDKPVQNALDVVRKAKQSGQETRRSFARNPKAFLRTALGDDFDAKVIDNIFVETAEYSERVIDIGLWEAPVLPWVQREGDKWLPEKFGLKIGDETVFLEEQDIPELREKIDAAISENTKTVQWKDQSIPASKATLDALDAIITEITPPGKSADSEKPDEESAVKRPVVLIIEENLEQIGAMRNVTDRPKGPSNAIPRCLKTKLKAHQEEGLEWLLKAWRSGQSGVLLADDMGLGKTLLTLSFLGWLRQGMEDQVVKPGPVLIVAPTGLLGNWKQEHDLHLHDAGLGECLPAHGEELRKLRIADAKEIDLGESVLNRTEIQSANWVLTTYETLRDYQHSFAAVKFSAVVFDEMQKIKTPGTIMTRAAKAMNGNFTIGLTGTPIENRLADLWCIIDTLDPGYLGDLKTFSRTYEKGRDEVALCALKDLLEKPQKLEKSKKEFAPVMLRRMKADKLQGLPEKKQHIHKHEMPKDQSRAYSEAIIRAQNNQNRGKMLEALHSLKSISLHPHHPQEAEYPQYLDEAARFKLLFQILDKISDAGEKALVFAESREMHEPLAGFIKRRYNLPHQPMIISGAVSGPKRQERVNQFQSNGPDSTGFDVMLLSPRAGGVGLTLTAANHVIHLSRWWNPAVEDQCTDRVFRIGQSKPVHVYYLQAIHPEFAGSSFDERLHELLERKRALSRDMLLPPVDSARDTEELYASTVSRPENPEKEAAREDGVTLEEIDRMEPVQFENWCLRRLKQAGYNVNKTPRSWDCGADGIAEFAGKSLIIQCKHTQTDRPCDDAAVTELQKAPQAYGLENASLAVVTNARGFTGSAQSLAQEKNVTLIAREQLLNWPEAPLAAPPSA